MLVHPRGIDREVAGDRLDVDEAVHARGLVPAVQGFGLDEDQIADMLSGIRSDVVPWLSGQPWPDEATRIRKERSDLLRDRDRIDARLAELPHEGEGGTDG